jgi:hypothetical protein
LGRLLGVVHTVLSRIDRHAAVCTLGVIDGWITDRIHREHCRWYGVVVTVAASLEDLANSVSRGSFPDMAHRGSLQHVSVDRLRRVVASMVCSGGECTDRSNGADPSHLQTATRLSGAGSLIGRGQPIS